MKIEPIAFETFEEARAEYGKLGKAVPPETMLYLMAMSQAISLKRIADGMQAIEAKIPGDVGIGDIAA